jgi:hypothetical protein
VRNSTVFSLCLLLAVPASGEATAPDGQPGDLHVGVDLDRSEQSGRARASVRIHAAPEVVWSSITDCKQALEFVPGLVGCEVLQTAPDRSWQLIRHVVDYSWFVRRLTYVVRASYDPPFTVSITRVSGDLQDLTFTWHLQRDGDYTIADYAVELSPGFWVPHWLVRLALRRDLPRMLNGLRTRSESAVPLHPPG